jgi:hypothetical protein
MKKRQMVVTTFASVASLASIQAHAVNQFENLSSSGTPVHLVCQGIQEPTPESATTNFCRLVGGTLPTVTNCNAPLKGQTFSGMTDGSKWMRVRNATSQALTANGTSVGNVDDRVWQRCGGAAGTTPIDDYIFGMQVTMNSNNWTEPSDDNMGLTGTNDCNGESAPAFEVNDMFRSGFNAITNVAVGYRIGNPAVEEGLWRGARTDQGMAYILANGGGATDDPGRNNDWVSYRTDASPEDPDGISLGTSAFMFVRASLGSGTTNSEVSTTQVANTLRIEEGGEEGQCKFRIQARGFKPL